MGPCHGALSMPLLTGLFAVCHHCPRESHSVLGPVFLIPCQCPHAFSYHLCQQVLSDHFISLVSHNLLSIVKWLWWLLQCVNVSWSPPTPTQSSSPQWSPDSSLHLLNLLTHQLNKNLLLQGAFHSARSSQNTRLSFTSLTHPSELMSLKPYSAPYWTYYQHTITPTLLVWAQSYCCELLSSLHSKCLDVVTWGPRQCLLALWVHLND